MFSRLLALLVIVFFTMPQLFAADTPLAEAPTQQEIDNLVSEPEMTNITTSNGYKVTIGSLPDTPNFSAGTIVAPDDTSMSFSSSGEGDTQTLVITNGQERENITCNSGGCQ